MRHEGTIINWKEDKGFGFIQPAQPGAQVFFHVADFRSGANARPAPRMRVSFELIHVGGKGPRAMAVRPMDETSARPAPAARPRAPARNGRASARPPSSGAWFALPLMLAYFALMAGAVWRGGLPVWVLGASFAVNVVTLYLYMHDKYSASQRAWRVSEDTLHAWSLAGGWPGAWFAQQLLRHKSAKKSFRDIYWLVVVLHCAAFSGALWFLKLLPF
jgi:uncharacterized membrane protein YsdA (DUF1294 family)/cold shock CspA family protein